MQLPRDCEELAQEVPYPAKNRNARVMLGRTTAALTQANSNIRETRECQRTQREGYKGT